MSGNTNKIIDEFDKKLLEKIDQQLMHIEAIKNYDPVKVERDELKKERDDLRGKLAEAHKTISRYKESTGGWTSSSVRRRRRSTILQGTTKC
jgi:uncharacterized coiled-coil DUF342 family protein